MPRRLNARTPSRQATVRAAADPRVRLDPVDTRTATSYLGIVSEEPIIAPSALKHGLDEPEILHAYRNPVRIWDLGEGFTMIVGPNQSAIFLEVGYVDGDHIHVIVHAMKAREKFLM